MTKKRKVLTSDEFIKDHQRADKNSIDSGEKCFICGTVLYTRTGQFIAISDYLSVRKDGEDPKAACFPCSDKPENKEACQSDPRK